VWLKWVKGRQNTGYEKMLIFQFQLFGKGFDCYLLRYRKDDEIPAHVDPIPGKKHYRLNVELVKAKIGGDLFFYHKRSWQHQYRKWVFFRSDLQPHKVTRVIKGERIVLTFGAAI
jgi:hypothetical protein